MIERLFQRAAVPAPVAPVVRGARAARVRGLDLAVESARLVAPFVGLIRDPVAVLGPGAPRSDLRRRGRRRSLPAKTEEGPPRDRTPVATFSSTFPHAVHARSAATSSLVSPTSEQRSPGSLPTQLHPLPFSVSHPSRSSHEPLAEARVRRITTRRNMARIVCRRPMTYGGRGPGLLGRGGRGRGDARSRGFHS